MTETTALSAQDLVGTWGLVRFVLSFSDGRPDVYPFGADAKGLIVYSAEGWMSAILSRADRSGFSATRLESASTAPSKKKPPLSTRISATLEPTASKQTK